MPWLRLPGLELGHGLALALEEDEGVGDWKPVAGERYGLQS